MHVAMKGRVEMPETWTFNVIKKLPGSLILNLRYGQIRHCSSADTTVYVDLLK